MRVHSPAFKERKPIPTKYTCDGSDVNPPLEISDTPSGAQSMVLTFDDPDAPAKTWLHWLVYDIPVTRTIAENSVPGTQGHNDFDRNDYGGPCPPGGEHRYYFRLYALDTKLGLPQGASRKDVENAMKNHVVAEAELMGVYAR